MPTVRPQPATASRRPGRSRPERERENGKRKGEWHDAHGAHTERNNAHDAHKHSPEPTQKNQAPKAASQAMGSSKGSSRVEQVEHRVEHGRAGRAQGRARSSRSSTGSSTVEQVEQTLDRVSDSSPKIPQASSCLNWVKTCSHPPICLKWHTQPPKPVESEATTTSLRADPQKGHMLRENTFDHATYPFVRHNTLNKARFVKFLWVKT